MKQYFHDPAGLDLLVRMHKHARENNLPARMKLIEDALEEDNFHSLANLLADNNYPAAVSWVWDNITGFMLCE
jgi:hypothetical protein